MLGGAASDMLVGPSGDDAVNVTAFVEFEDPLVINTTRVVQHASRSVSHGKAEYPVYTLWDGGSSAPLLGLAGGNGVQLVSAKVRMASEVLKGCFASVQVSGAADVAVSRSIADAVRHGDFLSPDLKIMDDVGTLPVLGMVLDKLSYKSHVGNALFRIILSPYSVQDLLPSDPTTLKLPAGLAPAGLVSDTDLHEYLMDDARGKNLFNDIEGSVKDLAKQDIVLKMKTNLPFLPWSEGFDPDADDALLRLIIDRN